MPAVSVVIATYDRAESILDSIRSVLAQTWTDLEVVVVDDGSTDATVERVESLSDPRVRVLSTSTNEGVSAARNRGIAASDSRWIAFQDSDDEWLPLKLERQLAHIGTRSESDVGAYCGMLVVEPATSGRDERTRTRYLPPASEVTVEGELLRPLLETSLISTQTMVVRRDALDRVGGFDESLRSLVDWEWAIRLAQAGTWAFVDEPLVLQRFSDNSLTRSVRRRAESAAAVLEKHETLYQAHPQVLTSRLLTIAGAYRRVGDYEHANRFLARARTIAPRDPRVWLATGWTTATAALSVTRRDASQNR